MKRVLFLYIGLALCCSCQIIKQIDFALKANRMTKNINKGQIYAKQVKEL